MSTAQCLQCGHVSPFAAELCIICGAELTDAQQTSFGTSAEDKRRAPAIPIGPFTLTSAFAETVNIFVRNLWLITKLVVVLFAPFEIFKVISFGQAHHSWQHALGILYLGLICQALIAPSLIYALHTVIRTGVAPSLNESYRWGLSRLPRFCIAVAIAWILIGCGLLLLVIPGLVLTAALMLVYPIATLEKAGPLEVVKRSAILTRGHRWNIFLLQIVLWIVNWLVISPYREITKVLKPQGILDWSMQVASLLVTDLVSVIGTVLALVVYLGILATKNQRRVGVH